ncbi:MAG: DEAD/DEAH box helicase [Synechococcaceae cyanobacterium SM2_3_2]|nr:DEAD/DEAH box helicase [Synechococcaceae cyanobacterium SM2_3_2]
MLFSELGLSTDILRAVSDQGYTEPTPIQQQAIPIILSGRDVMASAQTGTGKTAGFTLPILERLAASGLVASAPTPVLTGSGKHPVKHSIKQAVKAPRLPRVLILTPTRELAAQVSESVTTYSKYLTLRSTAIFGGVGINPQIDKLRRGVDLLVATPGRLLDHVGQRTVDLSQIEMVVLDEADRMLDMGFIHDIRRILHLVPRQRQTLMFSATFSDAIKKLADEFLTDPATIEVARRNSPTETVSQSVYLVDRNRKRELLSYLIGSQNWKQVLVFTRTKHGANRLAEQLDKDGLRTATIHGNKSQAARTRALSQFKQGSVRVLVATDIAARGLDIDQLPHVVNFEMPNVPEDYVHRIGRTGRAGNLGQAISLVCVDEHGLLRDIERLLRQEIPTEVAPGYEPDLSVRPEPIQRGRQDRGGRGGQSSGYGGRPYEPRGNEGRGGRRFDRQDPPRQVAPRRAVDPVDPAGFRGDDQPSPAAAPKTKLTLKSKPPHASREEHPADLATRKRTRRSRPKKEVGSR